MRNEYLLSLIIKIHESKCAFCKRNHIGRRGNLQESARICRNDGAYVRDSCNFRSSNPHQVSVLALALAACSADIVGIFARKLGYSHMRDSHPTS